MDKAAIREAISVILTKAIPIHPNILKLDRMAVYFKAFRSEDLSDLIAILTKDTLISDIFDGKTLNTGDGGSSVNLNDLARWLTGESILKDIDSTINHLESYLNSKEFPCWQILAISGVKVESDVNISKDLKLIPFKNLPSSYAKDSLDPPFLNPDVAMQIGIGFIPHSLSLAYKAPESALVKTTNIQKKTYSKGEPPQFIDPSDLYEFGEFLTLVKNSTPVGTATWCDLPEEFPCKPLLGGGWSGPMPDIISRTMTPLTQQEWDEYKYLYEKFVALPQEVRDLLRIPLERINQARRRSNLADKAIDLGVACEALFLNDKSHKEQISFTLRLRAALLLGSSFDERQEILNFFSAFYGCRSQAAHTGKLDTKIKVSYRGKIEARTILEEGDKYCVEAIIKIIEAGHFPDWNVLMLKKELAV